MKRNEYISKLEQNYLLITSFLAFIFSLSFFLFDIFQMSHVSDSNFSQDYINYTFPGFHLITLFIFLSLLFTKRYIISFFLTIFYVFCNFYSFYLRDSYYYFSEFPKNPSISGIYSKLNFSDIIAFLFAVILLFWQISILLRMLIKTLQKRNGLL